jgi:hypothetical protein
MKLLFKVSLAVLVLLFFFSGTGLAQSQEPPAQEEEEQEIFTLRQKRWAIRWFNRTIGEMMEDKIIETIKSTEKNYLIYVSDRWYFRSHEERARFVQNTSWARAITGHDYALDVIDSVTKEKLATVSKYAIRFPEPRKLECCIRCSPNSR